MNYIIAHDSKLIVELEDNIKYLEDHEEEALDILVNEDPDYIEKSIGDTKIVDLSIKDIFALSFSYDIVRKLVGLDIDKLLIYWMMEKGVDFEIEDNINIEEFKENGYNIIKLPDEKEE